MQTAYVDHKFRVLVNDIMSGGDIVEGRNGKIKRSFFPYTFTFNSAPILGWRKMNHMLGIKEMEWFVTDAGSINGLDKSVQPWWKPFSKKGSAGQYHYWWYYADLPELISNIKDDPFSRRHVLSCWDFEDMVEQEQGGFLTNCHSTMCQFNVDSQGRLNYKTYQRSADVMLGLPYNLIQHWALLEYVAHQTGYKPGTMYYILGDAHIYESHWKTADKMLTWTGPGENRSTLEYKPSSDRFNADDFRIVNKPVPVIADRLRMEV